MTEQEYKLPYRIHLVPITGPSIETKSWACGECKTVRGAYVEAYKCCLPRLCLHNWRNHGLTYTTGGSMSTVKVIVTAEWEMNVLPCPFCGGDNSRLVTNSAPLFLVCGSCGAHGPQGDSQRHAVDMWNCRPNIEPELQE